MPVRVVAAKPPGCRLAAVPGPSRAGARRARPSLITAFAHTASDHSHGRHGTYERVLRYPDGKERRIRYPAPVAEDGGSSEASGDSWEGLNVWKAAAAKPRQPERGTASGAAASSSGAPAMDKPQAPPQPQVGPGSGVPDSPLQLLRYLTSDKYKSSQRELARKVRESYEILEGSPWVAPRPLYVLATQQPGREAALTYTLRTRVGRADMEDELTRVLGRRRPDGSPVIRCSEVKDGVVAFESEVEANRFAEALEADGAVGEVAVARCDSHALFRSVQGAAGVVVLLRPHPEDGSLPQPHQLATALRGQRSLEDPTGSVDE